MMLHKICRRCNTELTKDTWGRYSRQRKSGWRICNACLKLWEHELAIRWKERNRDYKRANYIMRRKTNGDTRYLKVVNKRPYSPICEICSRERRTVYHHWDNNDYSKGLWLCGACHSAAEGVEKGLSTRYTELKRELEEANVYNIS